MPHTQEPSFHEAARAKATGLDDQELLELLQQAKENLTQETHNLQRSYQERATARVRNLVNPKLAAMVLKEEMEHHRRDLSAMEQLSQEVENTREEALDPEMKAHIWTEEKPGRGKARQNANERIAEYLQQLVDYARTMTEELTPTEQGQLAGIRTMTGKFQPNLAGKTCAFRFPCDLTQEQSILDTLTAGNHPGNAVSKDTLQADLGRLRQLSTDILASAGKGVDALNTTEAENALGAVEQAIYTTRRFIEESSLLCFLAAMRDREALARVLERPSQQERRLVRERQEDRARSDQTLEALRQEWEQVRQAQNELDDSNAGA